MISSVAWTSCRARQAGATLMILLCVLAAALSGWLVATIHDNQSGERAALSAVSLARAHEALVAYASSVSPDTAAKRPGDLPCPDLNNDGSAELTCVTADKRIGRLPWKTLDLPDLRDGSNERLWYALSGNFDRTTSNQCPIAGTATCLNSDTPGTLTVRDTSGATIHDGSDASSGAVAVIIAAGDPLQRVGESSMQVRDCSGDLDPPTCESTGRCSGNATALCDPRNYLDRMAPPTLSIPAAAGGEEDNATFTDADSGNGFVQGPIRDLGGAIRLNDRLRTVRRQDLTVALEKRVARHALRCLRDYAEASSDRMPWAAPAAASYAATLVDEDGIRFGRLPQALDATAGYPAMQSAWEPGCPVAMSAAEHLWWANWKDQVFYAVATGFAPDSGAACGACLALDPPSPFLDKRAVVLVAGKALSGQVRGVDADISAYLESGNADGDDAFTHASPDPTFNDLAAIP